MLLHSKVANYVCSQGEVKDLYELGPTMLIVVTTDRMGVLGWPLNDGVPEKGRILSRLSNFWAKQLDVCYYVISNNPRHLPEAFHRPDLAGRTVLVERAEAIPFDCVVSGFLTGPAWEEYSQTGTVGGETLPGGLQLNSPLPRPLFTPFTYTTAGKPVGVSVKYMSEVLGEDVVAEIQERSVEIYQEAAQFTWDKGIILADTTFKWGWLRHAEDELMIVDEILTPDNSRYWLLEDYKLGCEVPPLGKHFLLDWLRDAGWDPLTPPPQVPEQILWATFARYNEVFERVTGTSLDEPEEFVETELEQSDEAPVLDSLQIR